MAKRPQLVAQPGEAWPLESCGQPQIYSNDDGAIIRLAFMVAIHDNGVLTVCLAALNRMDKKDQSTNR